MNNKSPGAGELHKWLADAISSCKKRTVLLKQLYAWAEKLDGGMAMYLQSPLGKAAFQQAVSELVAVQILSPVGKKPATPGGLHRKYRIIKEPVAPDAALHEEIIRAIAPPAELDYYLRNPQDFRLDQPIIEVISNFLRQPQPGLLTVNERAYQLFGDEKFFQGAGRDRSRGARVLKRLGLGYAHIGCRETAEPFFSFQSKDFHARSARDIYIIENKDTFWSFKEQIMDQRAQLRADLIIYGEGKKIISSFQFVDEYAVKPEQDGFYYFGDLDPEGINIYCLLREEYPQYNIQPFVAGYQALIQIGLQKAPVKTPKAQRLVKKNVANFLTAFEPSWAAKIGEHLLQGFYIPQEALSALEMKERFGQQ